MYHDKHEILYHDNISYITIIMALLKPIHVANVLCLTLAYKG